ncbi:hypothetical protein L1987_80371 [Smallanthus sonchifolius]|uniref:Uncharacterized protein n=1 Tax=Smallanthus sonchifolius TaxID=185202 RepID=A0ACB8YNK2_9ASTR|nr:hypothetical protein L1987_80371 [Smallanthus sonchifolius]
MFDNFKISLSSFRLCRRKTNYAPTTHFFSPFNPKALEIAYPTIPSAPPTTPIYRPYLSAPLTTTPEFYNSPISFDVKCSGDPDTKKKVENNMGLSDESGWFSNNEEREPDSRSCSVGSSGKEAFMLSLSDDGVYKKMMNETLTVVQWSDHPHEDFKRSMLEMILEKQMFEAKDLEHLLQCFLTLNSRNHHTDIVAAFTEIWELLFQ